MRWTVVEVYCGPRLIAVVGNGAHDWARIDFVQHCEDGVKFTICIPTIRPGTLDATIASIRNQTWTDWELVIVGQGVDPALHEAGQSAEKSDQRIRFIVIPEFGVSRARNAGIRAATGDVIAFIDDDCQAHIEWLSTFAQYLNARPDVGMIAGTVTCPPSSRRGFKVCPGMDVAELLYDPTTCGFAPPIGWTWGSANFAVRRGIAEQVGPFDEWLGAGSTFPAAEEVDYGFRMERAGVKAYTTPRAVVDHTYGWRYGLRATLRLRRSYWRGSGALAAKLTLLGDARGSKWLKNEVRQCLVEPLSLSRYPTVPNLPRLWYFLMAYRECLYHYEVDRRQRVLHPKSDKP